MLFGFAARHHASSGSPCLGLGAGLPAATWGASSADFLLLTLLIEFIVSASSTSQQEVYKHQANGNKHQIIGTNIKSKAVS